MFPKTRLGKRSPLGALVSSSSPVPGPRIDQETGETSMSRVKGHPGLKVYFQCGPDDPSGSSENMDLMHSDVSMWPSSPSSSSAPPSYSRSVSSSIDVPRSQSSPDEVDMDEMMAAMVLSSLSCSPLMHSPPLPNTTAPPMDCGGGQLSDSSSGYWSVGHGDRSPTPSPPRAESDARPATPPDEGLDMEMEQVLFEEPAPRKRRNSVKVAFRCLWPSCGKVLTSVVGIKRHIRTTHLSRGAEHERCSHSEEDFYYTEINQWERQQQQSPPLPIHSGPTPSSPPGHASSPPSPPPPSPPSPPPPGCGVLSRSAPSSSSGSFWQVQSEHSYQAPPPSHMIIAAAPSPACRWMTPPTSCQSRQGLAFRVRSVSVGEQWLQQHGAPCRRTRGEAKKCRKVYGVEHRAQWCTACRWKKACTRFLD